MLRKSLPILLLASSIAAAQTMHGTGGGLDKLDEQLVQGTLASNGLETLLARDFKNFNVPESQQDQVLSTIQLHELATSNFSVAARRKLAVKVAKGLSGLLPRETDPQVVFEQANQLSTAGVVPTVTELEYFGENPVAQADLQPVATTAQAFYAAVADLATKKKDAIANTIKNVAQLNAAQPKLQAARQLMAYGTFCTEMSTYSVCISLPKDDPQRKAKADASIKALKENYDNADNGIQPSVRVQIGKLQLVGADYAGAFDTFEGVKTGKDITPAPSLTDQNTARYFQIVTLIQQRKLNDAEAKITDLDNWETATYVPSLQNPSDQDAVKAAMSMLKFRLFSRQADLATGDEQKQKNDAAINVLADLLKAQPSLKDLVFDQLIGRIPQKPDYATLNPLILQALQTQGFAEVVKPDGAKVDQAVLTRAIAAAQELVNRNSQPGGDAAAAGLSSYFIAYAYDKMEDAKNAATAFMDFAEKYSSDSFKGNDAVQHAGKWVFKLRDKNASDPDNVKLYDRFLPLAINPPYNMKSLSFEYAALLEGEGKYKESVEYFGQVPQTDKRYASAQYLKLLSLYKELSDKTLVGDERTAVVNQILDSAKNIDGLFAAATTPEDKARYVEWVETCDLIAADLTLNELKKPDQALAILNGFEDRVATCKDPTKAHLDALQLRISAEMGSGKTQDAVNSLLSLMQANPIQGQGLMFDVLKGVEHDEDEAKDPAVKKTLAAAKATLSSFVVDWASKSKEPKVQAAVPAYTLYSADANREAAELSDDAAAKKANLQAALKSYQSLYNQFKDDTSPTSLADAALQGVGLTQYDLGNYKAAIDALSELIADKKVGEPMMPIGPANAQKMVPNPQFWETNYKDIRSIVEVYKQTPGAPDAARNLEAARQYVETLFLTNGKNTGGETYNADFEKLRTEIPALQKGGVKPAK
jgi:hypothetical protein